MSGHPLVQNLNILAAKSVCKLKSFPVKHLDSGSRDSLVESQIRLIRAKELESYPLWELPFGNLSSCRANLAYETLK